ncbi:M28 family metallopeptidase [candidate division KSB1 bacterium]
MRTLKRKKLFGMFVSCAVFAVMVTLSASCGNGTLTNEEITVLQTDIMAKLTGAEEISPGVTIPNRNTPENREIARQYIFDTLREFGYEPVRHPYREDGENVYAVLDATAESDEYVLLGAHFDSVRDCPGANDDGSGTVMVLTIARMMKQVKGRSKNMIFVLFDEEERRMQGSGAFAQKLQDEGLNVVSVHTIDQMCWDEDGDRAIELEIPYDGAVELYAEAKEAAGFTFTIHITEETGSDHRSFRRLGFNAVGLTEEYRNGDTTPHYHKPTDTFDTVNFEFMLSSTLLTYEAMKLLVQ